VHESSNCVLGEILLRGESHSHPREGMAISQRAGEKDALGQWSIALVGAFEQ
jgi:hypothetical protein